MTTKVRMTLKHANGSTADIDVIVHPEWAPLGAERFLQLIDAGYFNNCPLYRYIPGFIVQWGIPTEPTEWRKWGENKIPDDPVKKGNQLATLSFATSGPSTLRVARPPARDFWPRPSPFVRTGQSFVGRRLPAARQTT